MKNLLLPLACLIILTGNVFGQNAYTKKEVITKLSAIEAEGNIYFNLAIKNETEDGYYLLIRKHQDGTFKSIGTKKTHPNQLNQPILYSFTDKDVPVQDVAYDLIRINFDNNPVIAAWQYNKDVSSITFNTPEDNTISILLAESED